MVLLDSQQFLTKNLRLGLKFSLIATLAVLGKNAIISGHYLLPTRAAHALHTDPKIGDNILILIDSTQSKPG